MTRVLGAVSAPAGPGVRVGGVVVAVPAAVVVAQRAASVEDMARLLHRRAAWLRADDEGRERDRAIAD